MIRDEYTITSAEDDRLDYLPTDMREQIKEDLRSGDVVRVEVRIEGEYNQQATTYCYYPEWGRGAICEGGDSDWTDCDGLDDIARRWADYDNAWCN